MLALRVQPLAKVFATADVEWLWEPFLARGKLALLDGDPGVGKSVITLDLAARLSRGGSLPNGSPAGHPRVTLLLSAEDDQVTLRARSEAAGADLERLFYASVPVGLKDPLAELDRFVYRHMVDLVVIDPIVAFLPPGAGANVDQCVRRVLAPLADIATIGNCAILLVRHLGKSPGARAVTHGHGSIGFAATARTVLHATRHPTDPARGVLAVAKSNLAAAAPALGYRIVSDAEGRPVVEWTGCANLPDAAAPRPEPPLPPRERASLWLLGELARGPRRATDLLAAAVAAGIPEGTLRRAKYHSAIGSHREPCGHSHEWYWYDPTAPWPADAPFARPPD